MDRRDDMVDFVFGNYEKVVFMAQTDNPELRRKAEEIAGRLKLKYEYRFTGYGDMEKVMRQIPVTVS